MEQDTAMKAWGHEQELQMIQGDMQARRVMKMKLA